MVTALGLAAAYLYAGLCARWVATHHSTPEWGGWPLVLLWPTWPIAAVVVWANDRK